MFLYEVEDLSETLVKIQLEAKLLESSVQLWSKLCPFKLSLWFSVWFNDISLMLYFKK